MTEDEKRQQKAMLLLQYEEAREELEHLRLKAWNLSQDIGEISHWLADAREMQGVDHSQRERAEKIGKELARYRAGFDFDAVVALRGDLKRVNANLRALAEQKQNLGLRL